MEFKVNDKTFKVRAWLKEPSSVATNGRSLYRVVVHNHKDERIMDSNLWYIGGYEAERAVAEMIREEIRIGTRDENGNRKR